MSSDVETRCLFKIRLSAHIYVFYIINILIQPTYCSLFSNHLYNFITYFCIKISIKITFLFKLFSYIDLIFSTTSLFHYSLLLSLNKYLYSTWPYTELKACFITPALHWNITNALFHTYSVNLLHILSNMRHQWKHVHADSIDSK